MSSNDDADMSNTEHHLAPGLMRQKTGLTPAPSRDASLARPRQQPSLLPSLMKDPVSTPPDQQLAQPVTGGSRPSLIVTLRLPQPLPQYPFVEVRVVPTPAQAEYMRLRRIRQREAQHRRNALATAATNTYFVGRTRPTLANPFGTLLLTHSQPAAAGRGHGVLNQHPQAGIVAPLGRGQPGPYPNPHPHNFLASAQHLPRPLQQHQIQSTTQARAPVIPQFFDSRPLAPQYANSPPIDSVAGFYGPGFLGQPPVDPELSDDPPSTKESRSTSVPATEPPRKRKRTPSLKIRENEEVGKNQKVSSRPSRETSFGGSDREGTPSNESEESETGTATAKDKGKGIAREELAPVHLEAGGHIADESVDDMYMAKDEVMADDEHLVEEDIAEDENEDTIDEEDDESSDPSHIDSTTPRRLPRGRRDRATQAQGLPLPAVTRRWWDIGIRTFTVLDEETDEYYDRVVLRTTPRPNTAAYWYDLWLADIASEYPEGAAIPAICLQLMRARGDAEAGKPVSLSGWQVLIIWRNGNNQEMRGLVPFSNIHLWRHAVVVALVTGDEPRPPPSPIQTPVPQNAWDFLLEQVKEKAKLWKDTRKWKEFHVCPIRAKRVQMEFEERKLDVAKEAAGHTAGPWMSRDELEKVRVPGKIFRSRAGDVMMGDETTDMMTTMTMQFAQFARFQIPTTTTEDAEMEPAPINEQVQDPTAERDDDDDDGDDDGEDKEGVQASPAA